MKTMKGRRAQRQPAVAPTPRSKGPGSRKKGASSSTPRVENPLSTYYLLICSVGILLGIGLVMVLSASSPMSYLENKSLFTVGVKQAKFAMMGLVVAILASRLPTLTWRRVGVPMLLIGVLLLAMMWIPGMGVTVNGNRNWLNIVGLQIQPSEFGKLGLILYGAHILTVKRPLLHDWRHAVVPVVVPAGAVIIGLVMAGGDLGTTIVIVGIIASMLWTAGISLRLFGAAAVAGAGFLAVMAFTSSNRMRRITVLGNCPTATAHDGACWQAKNGQFALADGGLWGVGLGKSKEKWGWLPERHNDFIFAIIGEELGIVGSFTILLLLCAIALACYRVILHTEDMFVRVATAGVMGWFVVQAVVNIGAVLSLFPVIGVPLPLVSAGGSALVTTLLAFGMVISFARNEPACRKALASRPYVLARSLSVMSPVRKRSR